MLPAHSANMTEAFTQLLAQVVTNQKDDGTKQMMKNIKTSSMEQIKRNASLGSARLKQQQNSATLHSEN